MDLDLKRVLRSRPTEREPEELAALVTPWGEAIDPDHVLDEHPRPSLERDRWKSLNGWWDYAITGTGQHCPDTWEGAILVPFSPEASLSRVGRQLQPDELLWYHRTITRPELGDTERCLLHLDAVDWSCRISLNGTELCEHEGGYNPVTCDITDALVEGENDLVVCVADPSETGTQLRGKQRLARGTMFYTAQSGIWQTTWLELVPAARILSLVCQGDPASGSMSVHSSVSESGRELSVHLCDADGAEVGSASRTVDADADEVTLELEVAGVRAWSCDDPYLYSVEASYGEDRVRSSCAFRTVSVEVGSDGVARFCLNHEPLLLRGVLDQGYWPDGLMTAPSDEALAFDVRMARELSFNMVRLHGKLECDRFYHHCDREGLLVWQDMVSGGAVPDPWRSLNIPSLLRHTQNHYADDGPSHREALAAGDPRYRREWAASCEEAVRRLAAHPSVACWVLFNESWGQFDSTEATERVRRIDPTRPIASVSGWYDQGSGDFRCIHNYFRHLRVYPEDLRGGRAFVISEFGGLTWHVDGHSSLERAYGYDDFSSLDQWRSALASRLDEVAALEHEGLSGFVYTQLTDVEEETNGLITYDRRVAKTIPPPRHSSPS